METVYISSAVTASMLYGYVCSEAMLKHIERDGCSTKTFINCIATPFMPVLVPLIFIVATLQDCIYGRPTESQTQITSSGFEGFQERTDNIANEDNKASNTNEN